MRRVIRPVLLTFGLFTLTFALRASLPQVATHAAPAAGSAHAGCPQLQVISVLLPASWHDVLQYLLPVSAGQLQAGWAHLFAVLSDGFQLTLVGSFCTSVHWTVPASDAGCFARDGVARLRNGGGQVL